MKQFLFFMTLLLSCKGYAQLVLGMEKTDSTQATVKTSSSKVLYGTASYYAKKFHGQKTASGETHRDEIYTAACNVFPLHCRIRVTNLKNNRSIIVKINDRMHAKNKRLIDLSQSAAKQLGYISRGVTKVKVELLPDFEHSHAKQKN